MTYNKAFFVFVSGIITSATIIFCMITKMFFMKNVLCGMVLFQIFLLGYLVIVSILDIKNEKRVKKSNFYNKMSQEEKLER